MLTVHAKSCAYSRFMVQCICRPDLAFGIRQCGERACANESRLTTYSLSVSIDDTFAEAPGASRATPSFDDCSSRIEQSTGEHNPHAVQYSQGAVVRAGRA